MAFCTYEDMAGALALDAAGAKLWAPGWEISQGLLPAEPLFFLQEDFICEVAALSVEDIAKATLVKPSPAEVTAGISTANPPNTTLLSGSVRADGVIAINLSKEFAQVDGSSRTTAVGQIVLGVGAQFEPDRQFSFLIAGEGARISTAGGTKSRVTPCDFKDALAVAAQLESEVREQTDLVALAEQNNSLRTRCPAHTTG